MYQEAEQIDLSRMTVEEIREYRNRYNRFAGLIGLSITRMEAGFGEARMKITDDMRNPVGSVHGGCISTTADVAGGSAASSFGTAIATLDCTLHFLRPGLADCTELIGTANVIKRGKRVIVTDVEVRSQTGTVLAKGLFSYTPLP